MREEDFVSVVKGDLQKIVRKCKLQRPRKNTAIIILECEGLHDKPYNALYPWGHLTSNSQPLTTQFQLLLSMVNETSIPTDEWREPFVSRVDISEQVAFSYRDDFCWDRLWGDDQYIGYFVNKEAPCFPRLLQDYAVNKRFVCVSSQTSLQELEKQLGMSIPIFEFFRKIQNMNNSISSAEDYISCVISNEDWIPEEDDYFEHELSILEAI